MGDPVCEGQWPATGHRDWGKNLKSKIYLAPGGLGSQKEHLVWKVTEELDFKFPFLNVFKNQGRVYNSGKVST